MKKIIAPVFILWLLITYVSNFSLAQTTNTPPVNDPTDAVYCSTQSAICGTAPQQFTYLMDFVREMMNAIKTVGPEWEYLGQYVSPNRFVGNVFTAPKKTIGGRVARNFAQKTKFTLATAAIFTSPRNFAGLKDMLWWVILLTKNQVFLRDNKLIEELDSQVNDKKYELGLWWWWYEKIIPENRIILQSIIDTYIKKWLLVPSSTIHLGASYNNVTSLLTQTLSAAKSFLYFGTTDQFDAMTRGGSDQITFIGFTDDAMAKVKREYNCARWPNYVCSSESKKLKEGWSKMWKSLSFWSKETKKTFTDAVDRLGQIFAKNQSQEFKDRQNELLTSMYGNVKVSSSTGLKWLLIDPFKKSWDGIKKSWVEAGQQFADLASDVKSFRSFPKDLNGTHKNVPTLAAPSTSYITTDVGASIDSYMYDVFLSQKMDLDLVSMSEVKGVTPAFAVLGQQVSAIKNNILGGKEKDNSLLKSLWAACELQCGRGWLCR